MHRPKLTPAQRAALDARQEQQAARLRRLRTALGVSQIDAARQAGLSPSRMNRMEKGEHPIDPLALQLFCEANHIGADYVIVANAWTLPDTLRDRVLQMEQQEMQAGLSGAPAETLAADIRARLEVLATTETPSDPLRPRTGKRPRNPQNDLP